MPLVRIDALIGRSEEEIKKLLLILPCPKKQEMFSQLFMDSFSTMV